MGRRASPGAVTALASLGAAVSIAGVQGIAPAIPAVQAHYGLSDAEVGLVTAIYLLPGIFSAFGAGLLGDRVGLRAVFSGSLALFAACALVMLVEPSYPIFMAIRLVQGAAFGGVMSLSVAVIAGVAPTGPRAARAQGHRAAVIGVGEAVLPALSGVLLTTTTWIGPFLLGLLALPLAVASWLLLPRLDRRRRSEAATRVREVLHAPALLEVQALGALRFVFKFGLVTYWPLLAVNEGGMSASEVGFALAAGAVLTAGAAAFTEKLAHRWSSAQLIGACLAVIVGSFVALGVVPHPVVLVGAVFVFGLQDGVFAVAHNVVVSETAPPGAQSTYIGLTGTVRNIGKFAAPLVFGAATLVATLPVSFLALAGASSLCIPISRRVYRIQALLRDEPPS